MTQKVSAFLITFNTNQSPKNENEAIELSETLQAALETVFKNIENYSSESGFLKYNGNQEGIYEVLLDDIEQVKVNNVIELGEKVRGGRIHSHTLLHIRHWTNIHVDTDSLKEKLLEQLPQLQNAYLNVKHVPASNKEKVKLYINKNLNKKEKKIIKNKKKLENVF